MTKSFERAVTKSSAKSNDSTVSSCSADIGRHARTDAITDDSTRKSVDIGLRRVETQHTLTAPQHRLVRLGFGLRLWRGTRSLGLWLGLWFGLWLGFWSGWRDFDLGPAGVDGGVGLTVLYVRRRWTISRRQHGNRPVGQSNHGIDVRVVQVCTVAKLGGRIGFARGRIGFARGCTVHT